MSVGVLALGAYDEAVDVRCRLIKAFMQQWPTLCKLAVE